MIHQDLTIGRLRGDTKSNGRGGRARVRRGGLALGRAAAVLVPLLIAELRAAATRRAEETLSCEGRDAILEGILTRRARRGGHLCLTVARRRRTTMILTRTRRAAAISDGP